MTEKIIILDFGSQYTQLIARAVREASVYCEIQPFHKPITADPGIKGVILSGSPFSVNDPQAPTVDVDAIRKQWPVLGICYGAQLTAKLAGGEVSKSDKREYGRAFLQIKSSAALFEQVGSPSQVWMSHSDSIKSLPAGYEILGTTESIPVAAFMNIQEGLNPVYGLQFHPEVYHSTDGKRVLRNFLVGVCRCSQDWTPAHFISDSIEALKAQLGNSKVVMGLSGGVDSTVAASTTV